jgi:ABC-type nitrate/sulfonate/bicarbonate transport system substrate-binding protein
MGRKQHTRGLALVAAGALLVAACGGDDDDDAGGAPATEAAGTDSAGGTEAPADTDAPAGTDAPAATEGGSDGTPPAGEPTQVGMAFYADGDPLIAYMIDSGIVAEVEAEYNVELIPTETPDDFAFFAGGHGDVITLGTYEVPLIEAETGIETVTFGGIRTQGTMMVVRADEDAETLADMVGRKIGFDGPGGSAIVWEMLVKELHDLDLHFDGGDFEVVSTGNLNVGVDLVKSGDIDAMLCLYEACAGQGLASGELKVLYDGRTASELYSDEIATDLTQPALFHNGLVARADWYDSHPHEVAFILELFQRGAEAWKADTTQILVDYAEELSLDPNDEEVMAYVTEEVPKHDTIREPVYLDELSVANEQGVVTLMRDLEMIDDSVPDVRYEIVPPPS